MTASQVMALYQEGGWPNVTFPNMTLSATPLGPTGFCPGDSTQLLATIGGSGQLFQWLPANGLNPKDSVNPRPVIHPSKTTTYTLVGSSGLPCPEKRDTQRITITVFDPPQPHTEQIAYLCRGDSRLLGLTVNGGKEAYRYLWSPNTTLDDATLAQPRVAPLVSTKYYVLVTDANGCIGRDSVQVVVYTPPTVNAGRDTTLCRGNALKIGSDSLDNHRYAWSPRTGLSDTTRAQPLASPDTTTRYIMTVTAPTGCIARDTIVVRVNAAATAEAGADTTMCTGASVMLGSPKQSSYSYAWTPTTGLNNPTIAQPIATTTTTTTYYLTATNASGCSAIDSVIVTVLKPALSVDQQMLDFGQLDGCTSSKDRTVVVSNSGESDLRITDATFKGTGYSMVSPPRPIALKPGETATITIRYAPTRSGTTIDTLMLLGSPCGVSTSVILTGTKDQSLVSADVSSVDFGRRLSCETIDTTIEVTISNSGGVDATVDALMLASPFSLMTSLPATISAGSTMKVRVEYKPTGVGSYMSELRLPYVSGACRDTLRLALNGIVEQPQLTGAPTIIDFGALSGCDAGRDTTITMSNAGTFDITLRSADIPVGVRFQPQLPQTIPAGSSRTFTIRFEPTTTGATNGDLILHYEPCNEDLHIRITGSKQGVSFSVPDSLQFTEVVLCREQMTSLTSSIACSGSDGSVASVAITGPFTTTLKSGDAIADGTPLPFTVTFAPTTDGVSNGTMDVVLQPCGITRQIKLNGSRTNISLIPSSVDFGSQAQGTLVTREVIFVNTSKLRVTIERLDGIAPPFSIVSTRPALPGVIEPGDTLHILVGYTGTAGEFHDTLRAVMSQPCKLQTEATLDGAGDDAATATITIPTIEAKPGDAITLPITLKTSQGLDALNAHDFTMDVAFNKSLLLPRGSTPLGIVQGNERVVTISGTRAAGMQSGEIARLELTAALGDTSYTPVAIRNFTWLNSTAQTQTENGGVRIISSDGWRLYLPSGHLRLFVLPNPANETTELIYEVLEPGRTTLTLRDGLGREIQTLLDADVTPGRYSMKTDVTWLAAGAYFYELRTATGRVVTMQVVMH